MNYLLFLLSQATKEWRFQLTDNRYPIKPVWGVLVVVAAGSFFLYLAWPSAVGFLFGVGVLAIIGSLIWRLVREVRYYRFAKKSQSGEKQVTITTLAEPPLSR